VEPVPIAYVIDQMGVGGTERQLATLISGIDRHRFEPHVFMIHDYDEWANLDCTKHLFRIKRKVASPRGVVQVLRMAAAFRRNRIRIVQTFFVDSCFVGTISAWMARVPVIITSRRDLGFWYTASLTRHLRRIHALSGHVLVNSESVRRTVAEKEGIPLEDIDVIHNGLDPVLFECDADSAKIKEELGIGATCPVVGIVANLNREVKRVDVFVDAVPAIAQKSPAARFVIVGKGHLRGALETRCRELGVSDKVTFTGGRDDVPRLLHAFDVAVNCSDSEGFSNAVLEYMLAGVPVVASDVGGNAELVNDEMVGVLFSPGEPASLAACVTRLLEQPDYATSVRERARLRALTEFTADVMVRRHMDYYDSLLAAAATDRVG